MTNSQAKNQKPARLHVKRGDTVMVIAGKDKGKTGTVKEVFLAEGKILVEGINIVKKAVRPNPMVGLRGGIVPMEAPFPASKVMLYSLSAGKPTRIKKDTIDAPNGKKKRVRVCRHLQTQLD